MTSTLTVCPEDIVSIVLPAEQIPDRSRVLKLRGDYEYTLLRNLTVYRERGSDEKPLVIQGLFLLSDRGAINQIQSSDRLIWLVEAEELVDTLSTLWEGTPQ